MAKNVQELTIKELIAMSIDIDVYDNVVEGIGIAFCGPIGLTDQGMMKFGPVMEYKATILGDPMGYDVCIITTDDEEPAVPYQVKLKKAKEFFFACAGYCDAEDWDKWFKDID